MLTRAPSLTHPHPTYAEDMQDNCNRLLAECWLKTRYRVEDKDYPSAQKYHAFRQRIAETWSEWYAAPLGAAKVNSEGQKWLASRRSNIEARRHALAQEGAVGGGGGGRRFARAITEAPSAASAARGRVPYLAGGGDSDDDSNVRDSGYGMYTFHDFESVSSSYSI